MRKPEGCKRGLKPCSLQRKGRAATALCDSHHDACWVGGLADILKVDPVDHEDLVESAEEQTLCGTLFAHQSQIVQPLSRYARAGCSRSAGS